jgi:hypothetical protein
MLELTLLRTGRVSTLHRAPNWMSASLSIGFRIRNYLQGSRLFHQQVKFKKTLFFTLYNLLSLNTGTDYGFVSVSKRYVSGNTSVCPCPESMLKLTLLRELAECLRTLQRTSNSMSALLGNLSAKALSFSGTGQTSATTKERLASP